MKISKFKKAAAVILSYLLLFSFSVSAFAVSPEVSFDGEKFSFSTSNKDLFVNFKGLMPGDTVEQQIKLVNDSNEKTTFSMCMKVADQEELTEQELDLIEELLFNSELIKITITAGGKEIYSDATGGSERKEITDTGAKTSAYLELGAISPNGYSTELVVTIEVSEKLDNTYADAMANIDWEFVARPFESGEVPGTGDSGSIGGDIELPETPPTGSQSILPVVLICIFSGAVMTGTIIKRKSVKKKN